MKQNGKIGIRTYRVGYKHFWQMTGQETLQSQSLTEDVAPDSAGKGIKTRPGIK